MSSKIRPFVAKAACAVAVLVWLAVLPCAGAAQGLQLVGAPVTLTMPSSVTITGFAESPVDGSFEAAAFFTSPPNQGSSVDIGTVHETAVGVQGPEAFPKPDPGDRIDVSLPQVIALAHGGFVAWWGNLAQVPASQSVAPRAQPAVAGDPNTVSGRILDGNGLPVGSELQLTPDDEDANQPTMAPLSSGNFVLTWKIGNSDSANLVAEIFSASGQPLSGEIPIAVAASEVGVVPVADGGFIVAWVGPKVNGVYWQRFDAAGNAVAAPVLASSDVRGEWWRLAANPTGQVAIGWASLVAGEPPTSAVVFAEFAPDGTPLASNTLAAKDSYFASVAVNLQGQLLVDWAANDSYDDTVYQLFDPSGAPVGTPSQLAQYGGVLPQENGTWQLVYSSPVAAINTLSTQTLAGPSCSPDTQSLCLDDNRFRFDVQFANPLSGGAATAGSPVPLSATAGALWFFDPDNPELIAKVIDGTAVNGHFWVFFASLSDVAFDLTVTDTLTGAQKVYHNPAGILASQADTAFPTTAAAASLGRAAVTPPLPPVRPSAAGGAAATTLPDTVCHGTDQALCLQGSQYSVIVSFIGIAGGAAVPGHAVQLSPESGYYWFFGPDDTELAVKLLDGTVVNGHTWLFYASLTDVEFDLTVTNVTTGATRTYHNAAGTLASLADTAAF